MRVAVVGATRLAVVAEPERVLVCGLDQPRRCATRGPRLAGSRRWPRRPWSTLAAHRRAAALGHGRRRSRDRRLPRGADLDGVPPTPGGAPGAGAPEPSSSPARRRRAAGPWRRGARPASASPRSAAAGRPLRRRLDLCGAADAAPRLYDHAFVLLALAGLRGAGRAPERSRRCWPRCEAFRHRGGFRESGEHPFQANAHMHLFEAALAWEQAAGGGLAALADEIAAWRSAD
jgi:hypothetical protein